MLPTKPGEKLTMPRRTAVTGRRKPTKNAIQNKRDVELRSAEAKNAAASSSAPATKPPPRASQSIGGFNLLANLVANKALAGSTNSSPRTTSGAN